MAENWWLGRDTAAMAAESSVGAANGAHRAGGPRDKRDRGEPGAQMGQGMGLGGEWSPGGSIWDGELGAFQPASGLEK